MTDDLIESSGNVFEDLGFKDSEQELLKARLALEIHLALKERGLTQTEAADLLGTTQPQISALMRLKPASVSIGRLMEFLTILGQDVEISVKAAQHATTGKLSFRSQAKAA
jgi:predicted XRE-type DNA-binding protein